MQWPSVRVCYSLRILVEYCLLGLNRDQLCFSFKRLAALLNLLLLQPDPAAAPRTHMALLTLRALVVMSAEQHKAINWYKFRPTNQSRGFQTLDTLQGEWKFKLAVATLNEHVCRHDPVLVISVTVVSVRHAITFYTELKCSSA